MSDEYNGEFAEMEGRLMARITAIETSTEATSREMGQHGALLGGILSVLQRMDANYVSLVRWLSGAVVVAALGVEGLRILAVYMGVPGK